MKPIERSEILGLGEYEAIRPRFRARVIEEKKQRRVALGPRATALFENRYTVMLQIQEMLRTERITREAAVQHEIDTYNEFIPGARELSCTVMIEIDDKDERDKFLAEALGIENAFSVIVDGASFAGSTTPDRLSSVRASAVIYLKMPLGESGASALKRAAQNGGSVSLRVEHRAYSASVELPRALVTSLAEDIA